MPIRAVDSDRLYRKIARQLSELIAAGEFAPGQRLPSERELAQQMEVSRPSVREALIALEIEGKVEVRVGAGVFVGTPRPSTEPHTIQLGEGAFELIRARWLIEGEIAAVAAREATPSELVEIHTAYEDMRQRLRMRLDTDSSDRDFHLAIASATHNSVLASMVEVLWDRGRGAMWKKMESHFQTPALRAATLRDHGAIYWALEGHDPRAARAAMHRHLARVDREFTRGWASLKKQRKAPERPAESSSDETPTLPTTRTS